MFTTASKKSMIIGCDIWMIFLELNLFFYDPTRLFQLSEFVWTLRYSVWVVFNNFLLINATDRSKIRNNPHRIFFDVSLNPLLFFANTPFKVSYYLCIKSWFQDSDLISPQILHEEVTNKHIVHYKLINFAKKWNYWKNDKLTD